MTSVTEPLGAGRTASPPPRSGPDVRVLLLLPLLAFLVYSNTLDNGFVHDDRQEIVDNGFVKDFHSVGRILTSSAWAFQHEEGAREVSSYYRPLQYLTYMAVWAVAGPDPFAFHLVKLLLHAIACLLLYLLLLRLRLAGPAAAFGAYLFAVHPVNTEAVAWISGLTDVSAAVLLLGAVLLHAQGLESARPARFVAGTALLYLVGLLAKETVAVLPAILLLHEVVVLGRRPTRSWLWRYLPLAVVLALYLGMRSHAIGAFATSHLRFAELGSLQCALTAVYLWAWYVWKWLLPVGQNAFYLLEPVSTPTDPRFLASVLLLAGCGWLAWRARRSAPAVTQGLAWFALTLAPVVLLFRHVGENVQTERYLYPAGVGAVAALAWAFERATPGRVRPWLAGGLLLLLGGLAVARNRVWQDELSFYSATAAASPAAFVIRFDLGNTYLELGQPRRAIAEWQEATKLRPGYADLHYNLGNAWLRLGEREAAVASLEEAIRLKPDRAAYHTNLGNIYYLAGDLPAAAAELEQAVRLAPEDPLGRTNLGNVLSSLGRREQALEQYLRALRLDPARFETHANLGILYQEMGQTESAVAELKAALRLQPDNRAVAERLRRLEARSGTR